MAASADVRADGRDPITTSRRPALDGLRTVAVYLVVLFHSGVVRISGGYIGVDVFFVLSGYLVTQVLTRDIAGSGSIRFARFYARRFRRLLPAAVVALLVTAAVYSALATPRQVSDAIPGFQAAFLYVTNWYFIGQATSYFGVDVVTNPVLHFWSLAVEEQFYLIWPLLLGGLFALTRRSARQITVVRWAIAAGALASLTWALVLRVDDPIRAYYGTDARAYQLLAGALLALAPSIVARLARSVTAANVMGVVALAALVFAASSEVELDGVQRGIAATVITVFLIAAIEAMPRGPVGRLLSTGPMVYLGLVSYGTYLWHWPVILVATDLADPNPTQLVLITALVATGLASLSYQILERPVRASRLIDRVPRVVIVTGLATSVICAVVFIPVLLRDRTDDSGVVLAAKGSGALPTEAEIERVDEAGIAPSVNCVGRDPSECTVVKGSGEHWLLMGDSNAQMMIPAFESLAREHDLTLSLAVTAGCPWQQNLEAFTDVERCRTNKSDAYERVIPALDPDVVVLMNSPRPFEGTPQDPVDTLAESRATIETLRSRGARIIIIEPMPLRTGLDPLDCLARAEAVEDCRFVVSGKPTPLEKLFRRLDAQSPDVTSVNLDRLACPYLPICDPVLDGTIVRWNFSHLSKPYIRQITDDFDRYFTDNRLVD
jgi:peptidoglycan/LPS O-acetylase OafA/YrhL